MAGSFKNVLSEENKLLGELITVVKNFVPETAEGADLCDGWKKDLTEWKKTNKYLIDLKSKTARKKLLKREKKNILKLRAVASDFEDDVLSQWWKDYLDSEETSVGALKNLP